MPTAELAQSIHPPFYLSFFPFFNVFYLFLFWFHWFCIAFSTRLCYLCHQPRWSKANLTLSTLDRWVPVLLHSFPILKDFTQSFCDPKIDVIVIWSKFVPFHTDNANSTALNISFYFIFYYYTH